MTTLTIGGEGMIQAGYKSISRRGELTGLQIIPDVPARERSVAGKGRSNRPSPGLAKAQWMSHNLAEARELVMSEATHSRGEFPNVVGGEELVAKQSAVNAQGKLRSVLIHDVVFRPARPVPHEDGHVC